MSTVTLIMRAPPELALEAQRVRPDQFAVLSQAEIAALPVWYGRERRRLEEFFEVRGGHSSHIQVSGETSRVKWLGAGMAGGTLVVEGDAGAHTGERMTGGSVSVHGDVGDHAGAEMAGGRLEVRGRAGAHLGGACAGGARGMTGGVIVAHGEAGEHAGERMRRGLLAIGGDAGDLVGAAMVAGTIVCFGAVGRHPAIGMKRGTVVIHGSARLLPTFRHACTYAPPFLRLYLLALQERYGVERAADFAGGRYRRYTGDYAELGKGEVLVWAEEARGGGDGA